jgi:hypothetical protein
MEANSRGKYMFSLTLIAWKLPNFSDQYFFLAQAFQPIYISVVYIYTTNTTTVSPCFFLSEFVDALSAPIEFMSAAQKRAKQMQEMGIDEQDISEVPVVTKKDKKNDKKAAAKQNSTVPNSAPPQTVANNVGGVPVKKEEKKGKLQV